MIADISPDVFAWTESWARSTGLKLWLADETESTNSIAKNDELPTTRPGSSPTLYLTRRQTGGRGRGNHTWTTPGGASLLSSWAFSITHVPQPIFSALVGLALYEACCQTWPALPFNVKAPNDLFLAEKKTAGILIETIDQGAEKRTVVGLGLNVTGRPAELVTATCLSEHLQTPLSEASWRDFLGNWWVGLNQALRAGMNPRLDENIAERLREALNRHPLLKEPILRVDELGQLHSASRIVHWHEL